MAFSNSNDFCFTSSTITKHFPLMFLSSLWKKRSFVKPSLENEPINCVLQICSFSLNTPLHFFNTSRQNLVNSFAGGGGEFCMDNTWKKTTQHDWDEGVLFFCFTVTTWFLSRNKLFKSPLGVSIQNRQSFNLIFYSMSYGNFNCPNKIRTQIFKLD